MIAGAIACDDPSARLDECVHTSFPAAFPQTNRLGPVPTPRGSSRPRFFGLVRFVLWRVTVALDRPDCEVTLQYKKQLVHLCCAAGLALCVNTDAFWWKRDCCQRRPVHDCTAWTCPSADITSRATLVRASISVIAFQVQLVIGKNHKKACFDHVLRGTKIGKEQDSIGT